MRNMYIYRYSERNRQIECKTSHNHCQCHYCSHFSSSLSSHLFFSSILLFYSALLFLSSILFFYSLLLFFSSLLLKVTTAVSGKTDFVVAGLLLDDGREVKESSKYRNAVEKKVSQILFSFIRIRLKFKNQFCLFFAIESLFAFNRSFYI